MKTKKLLCLVLSLLMLSAVSCQKDDTEVVSPEEVTENTLDEPAKVYSLAGIRENIADYKIVRSDISSDKIVQLSVAAKKAIKAECGVEPGIATDWDAAKEGEHEILIGKTNRESSIAATDALEEGKYSITDDGQGNIVIAGYDDNAVEQGVNAFLMQYFGYEPEEVVNMVLHNVKDYGAVGDNKTDDTEAFKKAVSEAEKDGLPVYVPAGTYIISDTITLKSVTLYGYDSGAWTADDCGLPKIEQANMNAPLFDVRSGSVAGLNIQSHGKSGDSSMKPTIQITGTGGRVSNMRIHTPYIGIATDDTSNPGRCFIENIFIVEAKEIGVYVAGTYDVPCVNNVEVWNPEETCPIAFKFAHNDDIRCVNLFAFNANVGFSIEKSKTGSCWGSFTNCSVDYTSIGFKVGEGDHHVTIVGGTWWTHHMGLNVVKDSEAFVAVSGCEMKSNGERTLNIEGGKTVTITGCSIIHRWDCDIPAVSVSGGKAVNISGNTIYSTATPISVTSRQKNSAVMITNNVIYTASDTEYTDKSKNVSVKIDNVMTTDPDEFKD